jgi:periplasmic protein TonB
MITHRWRLRRDWRHGCVSIARIVIEVMMPQRTPTTSNLPAPVRETFTWPPSTDELEALEVIALDDRPAPMPTRRRKADLAQWGLTLASLAAIIVALVLQLADWRGIRGAQQDAALPATPPAPSVATALAASATTPSVDAPAIPDQSVTSPPPRRAIVKPAAAFIPARTARTRERQARTAIDSPPLRLPESYVQPRLVASGNSGRGRVRGEVVLGVHVRPNGRVGAIDVLSGDGNGDGERSSELERAAVAAVKQWRYRPALRDGVPTAARLKVIVKFS